MLNGLYWVEESYGWNEKSRCLPACCIQMRNEKSVWKFYLNFIMALQRSNIIIFTFRNFLYNWIARVWEQVIHHEFFIYQNKFPERHGKKENPFECLSRLYWCGLQCDVIFKEKERFLYLITMGNLFNGTYGVSQ